jgi:hypothetical protein
MTDQPGAGPADSEHVPEIIEVTPEAPPAFGVLEGREPQPAIETPAVAEAIEASHTTIVADDGTVVVETASVRVIPMPGPAPTPTRLRRPAPAAAVPAPRRTNPADFGRIDDGGTVWLRTPDGEIAVGNWAAGTPEEGLAFFGRKYDDLLVEVDLAAHRLREGRGLDTARTAIDHARAGLAEPAFLGDVVELARVCDEAEELIAQAQKARDKARQQQRAEALAAREAIVVEAESLTESRQWKATGERFAALLDAWKSAPRVDRNREQALWKRFSTARTSFDRARRQHFASRESERREAVAAKESLIAEAEALATSTEWGDATRQYRTLMDRWKAAGHAGRQVEDKLWARFRAAQDTFFAARDAANAERDVEFKSNLEGKLGLLTEAEALLPVKDLESAKQALRSIQERWEEIGHVPRTDKARVEKRLRAVEESVRSADQKRWVATDPERLARASDTAEKFRASLDKAEKALAEAVASGNARAVAKAEDTVASTRALLAAVEGTMSDFGS